MCNETLSSSFTQTVVYSLVSPSRYPLATQEKHTVCVDLLGRLDSATQDILTSISINVPEDYPYLSQHFEIENLLLFFQLSFQSPFFSVSLLQFSLTLLLS
ncbi:hypothetical protein VNO78_19736 [Psophocarpus tetragonolobus]|uniref:Uncharacterized protein n=1 Tax=Psophocarpus tetragonolobus TaxID=3891 RepID=A0AAN9S8M3_PSOTE